jgi:YVTN family beta-propeller protein
VIILKTQEYMNLAEDVRMTGGRACQIAAIGLLFLICISCGDTFRPVAVPVQEPPPDPGSFHFAIVVSDNGTSSPGTTTRIDVSGDSNVGNSVAGFGPVHAALLANAGRLFIANNLEDTVSSYAPPTPGLVTTTSLPQGSKPVFIATSENANVYVANSGTGTVAVVNASTNVVTNILNVGINPMALVETPDMRKVYVANQGSNSVNSINTIDKTVNPGSISTGTSPVWLAARSDSARVYVLNSGSGTVSTIDTSSDAVIGNVSVGAGGNYMVFDPKLNRLYITNPVANTFTALDISGNTAALLFSVPVISTPVSVAVLPDGSRAYVASFRQVPPCTQDPTDLRPCIVSEVTAINTSDGSLRDVTALQSTVSITGASQSGTDTTYTYTLTAGPPPSAGMNMVITGMADAGNNGTFTVTAGFIGSFTVTNSVGVTASAQSGIGTNAVEVDTTNPTGCGAARFRFSMAASATSHRVYVGNCDAGNLAIIRTVAETSPDGTQYASDTVVLNLPAPVSAFPAPTPTGQPPAQNPVFILPEP